MSDLKFGLQGIGFGFTAFFFRISCFLTYACDSCRDFRYVLGASTGWIFLEVHTRAFMG